MKTATKTPCAYHLPEDGQLEAWRIVFRRGFAPLFELRGLLALRDALEADSPQLLQQATTYPPPLTCNADLPVVASDPVVYAQWPEFERPTVAQAEELFAVACQHADEVLGEPTACRYFLNWWDDAPREEARLALLEEVRRAIQMKCDLGAAA